MEKDIDRITKNPDTDIIIRIDDFGGKRGLTIREFVKSERYTGFTKAGTRIPAEQFKTFKAAINSIDEADMVAPAEGAEVKQETLEKPAEVKVENSEEKVENSEEKVENSEEKVENIEEKAI